MKTISKLIRINDNLEKAAFVGDSLVVEVYPRVEAIISFFLNAGYELHSRNFRVAPKKPEPGELNFYLGGWDLLFVKTIEDTERDDSDDVLNRAIASVTNNNNNSFIGSYIRR